MKERLDVLLVKQGLAESREKAKAVIMAGEVFVQGQREDKAGAMFDESKVTITVKGSSLRYVSRGGLKLEKAMACFPITLEGDICMDIGSSTGGFTDCMLQNGAKKVYSVDVGHGQLAWKLRQDERVVCMEKTNFRYLTREQIADDLDFASVDVSFISLTKILLPAWRLLKCGGQKSLKRRRTDGLSDQTTVRGRSGKGREKGRCPRSGSASRGHCKGYGFCGAFTFFRVGVDLVADQGT